MTGKLTHTTSKESNGEDCITVSDSNPPPIPSSVGLLLLKCGSVYEYYSLLLRKVTH